MELIAFYLPQFHEIAENNQAWGKGFTEWFNVKKAVCLFEGHNQPREPLNDNYYDLLDIKTMKWQISLAKKYGISGFCFYHYWFRNGKKVLEKPAEMFLSNKELDIPFCFSWANEPWTKTWHGAAGEREVLLEQRYGGKEQWRIHFEYLLPFFKDERYIKIDGKPVFLIYQINKIGCFNCMMDYWNDLAVSNGINGIYIVDMLTSDGKIIHNKRVSASVDFEPGKERRNNIKKIGKLHIDSYDDVCIQMIASPHKKNEYRCMFVDYDDSPRRGEKGNIFLGTSPEKFGRYLQKTIQISDEENNGIVFINAWNEWGEGNYLEPDKKNKYGYLEAIKNALNGVYDNLVIDDNNINEIRNNMNTVNKYRGYYELCNQWIKNINYGYDLADYFMEKGYYDIAIYGMGELGNRLVEALRGTQINIKYGIDKNIWAAFAEIDIIELDEKEFFYNVDCIVVTTMHIYDEILKVLKNKTDCDIVSIEDVIYGI